MITRLLDLGSGPDPKNIFNAQEVYGIDVEEVGNLRVMRADLAIEPICFPDNYFNFVTAFDFIEHIPRIVYHPQRRYSFVELMNEIYRVLVPGGIFLSLTPAFPNAHAFRDPTHVNIITEETFALYFDDHHRLAKMYGFSGFFKIRHEEWRGQNLMVVMEKVLP